MYGNVDSWRLPPSPHRMLMGQIHSAWAGRHMHATQFIDQRHQEARMRSSVNIRFWKGMRSAIESQTVRAGKYR